jgi:hypothetical protein
VPEKKIALSSIVGNLTSRFIKVSRTSNPPVNRSGPEELPIEMKRDEDDENQ